MEALLNPCAPFDRDARRIMSVLLRPLQASRPNGQTALSWTAHFRRPRRDAEAHVDEPEVDGEGQFFDAHVHARPEDTTPARRDSSRGVQQGLCFFEYPDRWPGEDENISLPHAGMLSGMDEQAAVTAAQEREAELQTEKRRERLYLGKRKRERERQTDGIFEGCTIYVVDEGLEPEEGDRLREALALCGATCLLQCPPIDACGGLGASHVVHRVPTPKRLARALDVGTLPASTQYCSPEWVIDCVRAGQLLLEYPVEQEQPVAINAPQRTSSAMRAAVASRIRREAAAAQLDAVVESTHAQAESTVDCVASDTSSMANQADGLARTEGGASSDAAQSGAPTDVATVTAADAAMPNAPTDATAANAALSASGNWRKKRLLTAAAEERKDSEHLAEVIANGSLSPALDAKAGHATTPPLPAIPWEAKDRLAAAVAEEVTSAEPVVSGSLLVDGTGAPGHRNRIVSAFGKQLTDDRDAIMTLLRKAG